MELLKMIEILNEMYVYIKNTYKTDNVFNGARGKNK